MRRPNCALLAVVAVVVALAGLRAQAPAETAVYAVAYVDVMPSGRAAAVAALKAYREASAKDAGHIRIDVFDQVGRPAHFVIVEAWRDQAAFDVHAGSAATKQFQQAIDKIRVSGYDQRPYKSSQRRPARPPAEAVHVVSHVDIAGAGAQAGAPAMLQQTRGGEPRGAGQPAVRRAAARDARESLHRGRELGEPGRARRACRRRTYPPVPRRAAADDRQPARRARVSRG